MIYLTRSLWIIHTHTITMIQPLNHIETNSQRGISYTSQGNRHHREKPHPTQCTTLYQAVVTTSNKNLPPDSLISKPIQQLLPLYPQQNIFKQVRQVWRRWLFFHPHVAHCNCFATLMIWDDVIFLLQYRLWSQYIFVNLIIIAKHVSCAFNWHPKHTEFVSQYFNQVNRILQCSEFTTKHDCFSCVITLA